MRFATILQNSVWLLLDRVIKLFGAFFVNAWVARYLGPDNYGVIAYILASIALFWGIANLGADAITVRELSKSKKNSGEIFGSIFVSRFVSGLIIYILFFLYLVVFKNDRNIVLFWAVCGLSIIFQSVEVCDLWFQSQSKSKLTVFAKLIAFLLASVLKIIFIKYNYDLFYFIFALLFESFVYSASLVYVFIKNKPNFDIKFNLHSVKLILLESWPVLLCGPGTFLYSRSDQLVIEHFWGASALGVYVASISFSQMLTAFPTILYISLTPYLTRIHEQDAFKFDGILSSIFKYSIIFTFLLSACVFFGAKQFIYLIYGDSFAQGYSALRIHVFTNIFIFLGIIQSIWFTIKKKTKLMLPKIVLGAVIGLMLNLILIPKFGIEGAATSAVISIIITDLFLIKFICPDLYSIMIGTKRR